MRLSVRVPARLPARLLGGALALGAAGLSAFALYAVTFGVTVDAGPWRERVEQVAGTALRREVGFDGPAELTLSLRPRLRVGGLRVRNPPGFDGPDLARLGEATLHLDLIALLRREVRLLAFEARDVDLRLQATADGRANWRLGADEAPLGAADAADPAPPAGGTTRAAQRLRAQLGAFGIDHFALARVAIHFSGAAGTAHHFALDRLEGEAPVGAPLVVRMDGAVDRDFPYTVEWRGGPLGDVLADREARPWPLALRLQFAGTTLAAVGTLAQPLRGEGARLDFELQSGDLGDLQRLLQVELPPVGATRLAGRVVSVPGRIELSELRGALGETTLQGHIALDTRGGRPRLDGELILPILDLRPFLGQRAAPRGPARDVLQAWRDLEHQSFDLRRLRDLDLDLGLSVGRWLHLPGDVRAASLRLELVDGVLQAPLRAIVAEVPFQGRLEVDGRAAPGLRLAMEARDTRLGQLARLVAGAEGVAGHLQRCTLEVSARGGTAGELARSIDLQLALDGGALSYGNAPGERPVAFRLDRLRVAVPARARLRGEAEGSLLGESFAARFQAGDLPALARELRWPVELDAQASGARLQLAGELAAAGRGATLAVALHAARAGSVARWLGFAPQAAAPLALSFRAQLRPGAARLDDFAFRLGRSEMSGRLARTAAAPGEALLDVKLDVATLDEVELQTLLPPRTAGAAGAVLDIPVLPARIELADADLELRVRRIRLGLADLTGIGFRGRVRGGVMAPSPFEVTLAGTAYRGTAALDLRGEQPQADLELAAEAVDVGRLLAELRVIDRVEARVERLALQLSGRGARLGELLAQARLQAQLDGGRLVLRDPTGQPWFAIAVDRGRLAAAPQAPVTLALAGSLDQTPVEITLSSGQLADFARPGGELPFVLSARAAQSRLDLVGRVSLPVSRQHGYLALTAEGPRLDTLDRLARTRLPPWGPWSLGGRFVVSGRGYEMPGLAVRVGRSTLEGRGALDFSGARPRVELKLAAPVVQLDDFPFGAWWRETVGAGAQGPPAAARRDPEALRRQAAEMAREGQRLLSRATLGRLDAALEVEVAQVSAGDDRLGGGRLHARLHDARLQLDPVAVEMPGGAARLGLSYEPLPGDREVRLQARAQVDRFDYAVLARRLKPDTTMRGRFSLDFGLEATAPLERLMERGNGRLEFAVWPANLSADTFDLWAVNLLFELLPRFDAGPRSTVNCAIGRFELVDGRLRERTLLIDTSRMRVHGSARVDFHDESLHVALEPRAKRPQLFGLATPVEVEGRITDFAVGVRASSVATTVLRFLGSVIAAPVQMVTGRRLPRLGEDVCGPAPSPAAGEHGGAATAPGG